MPSVLVCCPNPACKGRSVQQSAEGCFEVVREEWWASDISCPRCGEDGIDSEDPGRLDEAEEELGSRCDFCGVVSEGKCSDKCPHCRAHPRAGRIPGYGDPA